MGDVCWSLAGSFFLEKLMMRVIFRPAALLIEPFSSARLLFFPLPVSMEMYQGRGGVPNLRSTCPHPPCGPSGLYTEPGLLLQVWTGQVTLPRSPKWSGPALHCVHIASPLPALTLSSLHPQRLLPWSQASRRPRVEHLSLMPRLSESEVCFSWDSL